MQTTALAGQVSVGAGKERFSMKRTGCVHTRICQPGRLDAGGHMAIFVGPVPEEKLPKDAIAGRTMLGSITMGKQSPGAGGGNNPDAVGLVYQ